MYSERVDDYDDTSASSDDMERRGKGGGGDDNNRPISPLRRIKDKMKKRQQNKSTTSPSSSSIAGGSTRRKYRDERKNKVKNNVVYNNSLGARMKSMDSSSSSDSDGAQSKVSTKKSFFSQRNNKRNSSLSSVIGYDSKQAHSLRDQQQHQQLGNGGSIRSNRSNKSSGSNKSKTTFLSHDHSDEETVKSNIQLLKTLSDSASRHHQSDSESSYRSKSSRMFSSSFDEDDAAHQSQQKRRAQRSNQTRQINPGSPEYTQAPLNSPSAAGGGGVSGIGGNNFEDRQKPHKRYRGFTSSISGLFQDEQIVCGAIACFGLLLSQRTEHLVNARNVRRGLSKKRTPSSILAYALGILLAGFVVTYTVWGITGIGTGQNQYSDYYDDYDDYVDTGGTGSTASSASSGSNAYAYYDDTSRTFIYDDDGGGNNRRRGRTLGYLAGEFKLRDWRDNLWTPILTKYNNNRYLEEDGEEIEDDDMYSTGSITTNVAGRNHPVYYNEPKNSEANPGDSVRAALYLIFLFVLGVIGRRRRMRTRYEVLKARTQDDTLFYLEGDMDAIYDTKEDKYEAACSHTLCGCYPTDLGENDFDTDESTIMSHISFKTAPAAMRKKDFSQYFFGCLSGACCGKMFKCWIQCFSICALAQEAREARLLVPLKLQRVDYLTHQPFHEYHDEILRLRQQEREEGSGVIQHSKGLSRLSGYLILSFLAVSGIVTLTLMFNPRSQFGIGNAVVVSATFGTSFMLLYFFHWVFHRSDLSLDAVIKVFSAGFLIGVPTAFIFEAILFNVVIAFLYLFYGFLGLVKASSLLEFIKQHNRATWIVSEILNAFFVAAMTEELCKYYTFRSIEHPDLIFMTDMDIHQQADNTIMRSLYPVSDDDAMSTYGGASTARSGKSNRRNKQPKLGEGGDDKIAQDQLELMEDEPDERTLSQMAGAITVAMVASSLGFSCAENFVYVFLLSDTTVMQKGAILFVRSIFPIHALGAALQSLGVIRKYILKDESVGVGRIILPALILHGTFDAVLMVLNCLQEETWNYYADDMYITEFTMPLWLSILSWIFVLGVVAGAVMFYKFGNRRQMHFIYQLENDEIEEDNIIGGGAGSGSYSLQTDDDSYNNNHNHNRAQRRRKQEEKYKAPKMIV